MENLKIKVSDERESKEAQELFFELGASWCFGKSINGNLPHERDFIIHNFGTQLFWAHVCETKNYDDAKEITLPQLRDKVVLKRNSVEDATHTDQDGWKWYIGDDSYVWQAGNSQQLKQWDKSSLEHVDLKPIEKEMKEYLEKQEDGSYKLVLRGESANLSDIEVPDGALTLIYSVFNNKHLHFTNSDNQLMSVSDIQEGKGYWYGCSDAYKGSVKCDVLWQRSEEKTVGVVGSSQWDIQVGGNHYKDMKIQPAKFALENKLDYCQANAIKYICRHEHKNGKQDLEKAKHYIDLLIEHYYGNS